MAFTNEGVNNKNIFTWWRPLNHVWQTVIGEPVWTKPTQECFQFSKGIAIFEETRN